MLGDKISLRGSQLAKSSLIEDRRFHFGLYTFDVRIRRGSASGRVIRNGVI